MSLTSIIQFCFVFVHCTFIYGIFNVIALTENILLRIARRPIGQVFFAMADCVMALSIEAAAYPLTGTNNFSRLFFVPAFIFVQWMRHSTSLLLFIMVGRTVSSEEAKEFFESLREMLQNVYMRGRPHIQHHRRPSFALRLLNIRRYNEPHVRRKCCHTAEESQTLPTFSDSNTQTTVHYSPNTTINSEPEDNERENSGDQKPQQGTNEPEKDNEENNQNTNNENQHQEEHCHSNEQHC